MSYPSPGFAHAQRTPCPSATHCRGAQKHVLGFTLVEVLVAMALLSLVMLGLSGALRNVAQVGDRTESAIQEADAWRVAERFVNATLGRQSVKKQWLADRPGGDSVLFDTAPRSVSWLGIMPARYGAGGRTLFKLQAETTQGASPESPFSLVIRYAPWTGQSSFPNWSNTEAKVLLSNLSDVQITYQDLANNQPVWRSDWPHNDRLPARIRVSVNSLRHGPVVWVVPVRNLSAASKNAFTVGAE